MSKKSSTGVNVGGSSILVIFILLCLTTFATLSMVSANADLRLTQKSAAATVEYYTADATAEEMMAQIDDYLAHQYDTVTNLADFTAACVASLPQVVTGATAEEIEGAMLVHYIVPMGDTHQLSVELKVVPGSGSYALIRNTWQVQSVSDWQPGTEGIDLWGGQPFIGDGLPPI